MPTFGTAAGHDPVWTTLAGVPIFPLAGSSVAVRDSQTLTALGTITFGTLGAWSYTSPTGTDLIDVQAPSGAWVGPLQSREATVQSMATLTPASATVYVSASGSDTNLGDQWARAKATIGAALSALPANGGRISVGGGSFQLSGTVTLAGLTNVTIEGRGFNTTQIVVNGDYDAFSLTGVCSRITFKDLWIGTFAARAAGYGVRIVGTSGVHSDSIALENVVIQNTAQAVLCQFADLVSWRRVKYIQSITSAAIGGALFRVVSSASHDFDRLMVQRTTAANIASDALVLDSDTDTMIVKNAELLNANRGIVLANNIGGSSTGPRLVRMVDCYSEAMTGAGFSISDGRDVRMRGCHGVVNGDVGFDIAGGTSIKLADCIALQNGTHGFYVHGLTVNDARLAGCDASNNSQKTSATYDGFRIDDNTSHVRLAYCRSGDFVFTLTNKQRYGLSIGSVSTDYIYVQGCDFTGNNTASVANFSSGLNNKIHQNAGYNPRGFITAPTIPASGVAKQNTNGTDFTVYVSGGTVTGVAVGGSTTGATSGGFRVPAGSSITLTYSTAPTWVWLGD